MSRNRVSLGKLVVLRLLFTLIYFAQKMGNNVEGISKMPVLNALKKTFNLSSEDAGHFRADSSVGWYVKALLGPIVDNLPLFGYRRKSWLMLSSALVALSWTWVALFGDTVSALFVGIMGVNLFLSLGDVVTDGMMVELSQKLEKDGGLPKGTANRDFQSAQWMGAFLAITIGAMGGGVIAQFFNLTTAAVLSGIMPLFVVFLIAFVVEEEKVEWDWTKARKGFTALGLVVAVIVAFVALNRYKPEGNMAMLMPLLKTVMVIGAMSLVVKIPRTFLAPALFLVVWYGVPFNMDGSYCYNYFTTHSERFVGLLSSDSSMRFVWQLMVDVKLTTQDDLNAMLAPGGSGIGDLYYGSVLGVAGAIGGVLSVAFFGLFLKKTPLWKLFTACLVANAVIVVVVLVKLATITPLELMGVAFVGTIFSVIALLSILSWAASVVPGRDQAALYAFLMSISNISQQYGGDVFGGKLYDAFGGMTKVAGADGGMTVVMQNADAGMEGVLFVSIAMIMLGAFAVAYLQISGRFAIQSEE